MLVGYTLPSAARSNVFQYDRLAGKRGRPAPARPGETILIASTGR